MASAPELQDRFAIPGVLAFEQSPSGLVVLHVTAPTGEATLHLQGAHLTHWKPLGHAPVLFLSPRAQYAPGKSIRGGIPIVFPWFGDRSDGQPGPQHGFARISEWELVFAALSGSQADAELSLTFTLAPNDLSRSLGFDHFRLACRATIGRTLTLDMTVANPSDSPLLFEQALHTYYAVADARQVSIDGLGGATYIDKVDNFQRKMQPPGPLPLTGHTDRPYLSTEAACVLHDPAGARAITVAKQGSRSTVVWNPWRELTAAMPDMEPDSWLHMAAIETANVADNAITLQPGEAHTMRLTISVEKTA